MCHLNSISYVEGWLTDFLVDFDNMNTITVVDCYLIPMMDECIGLLRDASLLSPLDAISGYWKTEIEIKDRYKTAFASQHLLFFCDNASKIRNTTGIFQGEVYLILSLFKKPFASNTDAIRGSTSPKKKPK